MSTTETGRAAEEQAAHFLEECGYAILQRNWRTRWHEVDIIARREGTIHFIEVKYRRATNYGSGFDYISRDKLQRLVRAVGHWQQVYNYEGDCQIDVVAVSGAFNKLQFQLSRNITG